MEQDLRPAQPELTHVSLKLNNTQTRDLTLHLEPWGDRYELKPGEAIELRAWGPVGGNLELHYGPQSIQVHGWPGSMIEVYRGQVEQSGSSKRSPAP